MFVDLLSVFYVRCVHFTCCHVSVEWSFISFTLWCFVHIFICFKLKLFFRADKVFQTNWSHKLTCNSREEHRSTDDWLRQLTNTKPAVDLFLSVRAVPEGSTAHSVCSVCVLCVFCVCWWRTQQECSVWSCWFNRWMLHTHTPCTQCVCCPYESEWIVTLTAAVT